jgi:hypothetical protein
MAGSTGAHWPRHRSGGAAFRLIDLCQFLWKPREVMKHEESSVDGRRPIGLRGCRHSTPLQAVPVRWPVSTLAIGSGDWGGGEWKLMVIAT